MSIEADDHARGQQERKPCPLITFVVNMYQQTAAVVGAFALIAFISNIAEFEWRGFLAVLVAQWDEYVRPVIAAILDALVTTPLGWFGWHVEVPQLLRDYVAVAIVLALSLLRARDRSVLGGLVQRSSTLRDWIALVFLQALIFVSELVVMLAWPVVVVAWIKDIVRLSAGNLSDSGRRTTLLALAPLAYLGVLLAINYLIL